MASQLTPVEYAFLIILRSVGREISNTEMHDAFKVRLVGPTFAKLYGGEYIETDKKKRPYRHLLAKKGADVLRDPVTTDVDDDGERRSPGEKVLWAALVAQQSGQDRTPAPAPTSNGAVAVVDLDARIRAAYRELAGGQGEWVGLTALRRLFGDVSKADLDRALTAMLVAKDVRLEPEPFGHRVGPEERKAAVRIGGEDRHKLAIGLR